MWPIRNKDLSKNREFMIKNLNRRINNKFLRIRKVSNFLQNIAALGKQPIAKMRMKRLRDQTWLMGLIKTKAANSLQYY